MQGPFWRMVSSLCLHSRISASACRNAFLGLLGAFLLLNPLCARADVYLVTFYNATFTATCIGGGTCTEVVNGSGDYNPITDIASNLSISLTGTLNASLDAYGTPICTAPGCLGSNALYDPNALPGFNPIEFNPNINKNKDDFNAPTPQPLPGGISGSLLFIPGSCGGDQPKCGTTGAFPGNGATDYTLTSGTYTSVDVSTPEPGSAILVVTGILGLLAQRGRRFL
jgi:hypothetical protein